MGMGGGQLTSWGFGSPSTSGGLGMGSSAPATSGGLYPPGIRLGMGSGSGAGVPSFLLPPIGASAPPAYQTG
jgi:hypothetical protein